MTNKHSAVARAAMGRPSAIAASRSPACARAANLCPLLFCSAFEPEEARWCVQKRAMSAAYESPSIPTPWLDAALRGDATRLCAKTSLFYRSHPPWAAARPTGESSLCSHVMELSGIWAIKTWKPLGSEVGRREVLAEWLNGWFQEREVTYLSLGWIFWAVSG